jgi:hypothetical protein
VQNKIIDLKTIPVVVYECSETLPHILKGINRLGMYDNELTMRETNMRTEKIITSFTFRTFDKYNHCYHIKKGVKHEI